MNIKELIPHIEKQAKKLNLSLWEDLTVIGLIKAWLLVRNGQEVDEALIVKAAKNAMVDYLRQERRKPQVVKLISDEYNETFVVKAGYLDAGFQVIEIEEFLNSLRPTVRKAIIKRLRGEALNTTERVALYRFRKSGNFKAR